MQTLLAHVLAFGGGILAGYLASTLIESLFHHKVSDAPRRTLRYWNRYPRLFAIFIRANYSHHVVHHGKTFQGDYVTQFRNAGEKKALDEELAARGAHGRIIRESQYAMSLHGSGAISFIAPFVPLAVLSFVYGGWAFGLGFAVLSCVSPWMNTYIHSYLHMPQEQALRRASAFMKPLLRTRYFKRLVAHHYLHHKYVACNFNLMLGGDWLRDRFADLWHSGERKERHRVLRHASELDFERMRALGLAVGYGAD
jgi:hypothetical protein